MILEFGQIRKIMWWTGQYVYKYGSEHENETKLY